MEKLSAIFPLVILLLYIQMEFHRFTRDIMYILQSRLHYKAH